MPAGDNSLLFLLVEMKETREKEKPKRDDTFLTVYPFSFFFFWFFLSMVEMRNWSFIETSSVPVENKTSNVNIQKPTMLFSFV